jgi:hypothetical protein
MQLTSFWYAPIFGASCRNGSSCAFSLVIDVWVSVVFNDPQVTPLAIQGFQVSTVHLHQYGYSIA